MGLKNFILMIKTISEIDAINKASIHLVQNENFNSFRITSKRNYKKLNFTSQDANVKVGEYIHTKTKKTADTIMNHP